MRAKYKELHPEGKNYPPTYSKDLDYYNSKIAEFEGLKKVESPLPASPSIQTTSTPEAMPVQSGYEGSTIEHVQQAMTQKMHMTKEKLDKSPRITYAIPLAVGEPAGSIETVTINGYRIEIRKGVMVEMPRPVFDLIANKYQIEQSAGAGMRADRSSSTINSLA